MQWIARYDGPANYGDKAIAIELDKLGNIYVTGYSYNSATAYDYTTIKYNSFGDTIWTARYNGPDNYYDVPTAMVLDDSGNVYVTGWSENTIPYDDDIATVKYNSDGVMQWVNRYDYPDILSDERANAIAIDDSGNVYVTGYIYPSGSWSDYLTIKYNPAGDTLWTARYNGPMDASDAANAIAVDGLGNVYVTGNSFGTSSKDYTTIKYNSNGQTIWVARYNSPQDWVEEARAMAVDKSGNVYVTGRSYNDSVTQMDYLTVKFDSSGVLEWVSRYPNTHSSLFDANDIVLDDSNYVYITGYSSNYTTIKYSLSGDTIWVASYQDSIHFLGVGNALAVDTSGNVYITGFTLGPGSSNDYSTVKYSSLGDFQWVAYYNGPSNKVDIATDIAVDESGNVYVTGYSVDAISSADYLTIKYVQGPVASMQDDLSVPVSFSLSQNYPNPFNPTTKIKFTIPQSPLLGGDGRGGFVTLIVYDVLGKEISTLVNEEKPAGNYEVEFNGEGLTSGIYFYQLRVGDPESSSGQGFIETKKMVLLR